MGDGHVPLSARHLAGGAQIRDVQLLGDAVRIGDQVVLVAVAVFGGALRVFLGGLLLLELSAFRARELRFPRYGRWVVPFFVFVFIIAIFLLFLVVVVFVFVVFLSVTAACAGRIKRSFRVAKKDGELVPAYNLSSPTARPSSSSFRFRLDDRLKRLLRNIKAGWHRPEIPPTATLVF